MSPNEVSENEIIENITSYVFLNELKKRNIDVQIFFNDSKNIKRSDVDDLNAVIQTCKTEYNLQIMDCVLFLERYIIDIKKAVELLNDKNYKELRRELVTMYKIKDTKNSLSKYFKK